MTLGPRNGTESPTVDKLRLGGDGGLFRLNLNKVPAGAGCHRDFPLIGLDWIWFLGFDLPVMLSWTWP
jgi:hypothetical protein